MCVLGLGVVSYDAPGDVIVVIEFDLSVGAMKWSKVAVKNRGPESEQKVGDHRIHSHVTPHTAQSCNLMGHIKLLYICCAIPAARTRSFSQLRSDSTSSRCGNRGISDEECMAMKTGYIALSLLSSIDARVLI